MRAHTPIPIAVNADIMAMEYAVRGPIPKRAAEMKQAGRSTILCNIGNPQALGQQPITFYRQVLSLAEDPSRIDRERRLNAGVFDAASLPPGLGDLEPLADEVLDLADSVLTRMETGMGAYSDSNGPRFIREAIAAFIDRRDGIASTGSPPSNPDHIYLTNGASEGAKYIIELLVAEPTDGIMIPIPQYPLYSATIRKAGGTQVDYYPDEDRDWALDRAELDRSLREARSRGVTVKAIVVINPGNPTGGVFEEATVREVIDFAAHNGLAIIADEVYQENVYGAEFVSFAKALGQGTAPLFSLHSTSKGFIGECGHRGGYMELRNPPTAAGSDTPFTDIIQKLASISLCPNTAGQLLTYLMVSPPAAGGETSRRFEAERQLILQELFDKATMIRTAFDEMQGVECFGRTGAMYLFPRLNQLPEGKTDFDYCMQLLETTGLCTVNGSGFGQKPGSQHLRIAFLPPKTLLEEVLPAWIDFHNSYVGEPGRVLAT